MPQDRTPVTKLFFSELCDCLNAPINSPQFPPNLRNDAEIASKLTTIRDFLKEMGSAVKNSGPHAPVIHPNMTGKSNTISKNAVVVSEALRYAASHLGFPLDVVVSVSGRTKSTNQPTVRVKWELKTTHSSRAKAGSRQFKRIFWVKNYSQGEYVDLLIRGAQIAAAQRNVTLHVITTNDQASVLPQAMEAAGAKKKEVWKPQANVFVFDLIDPAAATNPTAQVDPSPFITSGYPDATVLQANVDIGRLAACVLTENCAASSEHYFAILRSTPAGDHSVAGPICERIRAFKEMLKARSTQQNFKYRFDERAFKDDDPRPPRDLCEAVPVLSSNDATKYGTINVFAATSRLAPLFATLPQNHSLRTRMQLVSADITPSLIALATDLRCPPLAICGVDPLEYGQLIANTALDCTPPTKYGGSRIIARPILLTRQQLQTREIHSTYQASAIAPMLIQEADEFLSRASIEDTAPAASLEEDGTSSPEIALDQ